MVAVKLLASGLCCGVVAAAYASAASAATQQQNGKATTAAPAPASSSCFEGKVWGKAWVADWDGRAGVGTHAVRRQLVLIRHGQYQCEGTGDDTVRTLTKIGVEQATITGAYLARAVKESPRIVAEPSALYVSDMNRATSTADLILEEMGADKALQPIRDPELRERFPCDPEPYYRPRRAKAADGEAAEKAFLKYFHRPTTDRHTTELIVGHANMIRYFLCRVLQIPPEAWLRFSLPHCSLTIINIAGTGDVSVSAVGDAGHLPPSHQTVINLSGPEEATVSI